MKLSPEALKLLRQTAVLLSPGEPSAFLVGGAIRDALLRRPVSELDIAVPNARPAAVKLAKAWRATLVTLDDVNGVYRIVPRRAGAASSAEPLYPCRPDQEVRSGWGAITHIDVSELQGDIESDLKRRDFTINALALPLTPRLSAQIPDGSLLDPRRGLADLKRRLMRTESVKIFEDDPLRLLRAFRLAAQLDFTIETKTLEFIGSLRRRSRQPAAERIQSELMALLSVPGASRWLRVMDECRLLTALFEDLEPSRKCAEVYYGEGGVMTHSLDTVARVDFLLANLGAALPGLSGKIQRYLDAREEGGVPHRAVLMLAALIHDVAKPFTARRIDGRLRFFGHDTEGARMAAALLKALRFSRSRIDTVSTIITHHLRPGNLAASGVPTDKAVYRFFRDVGADAVSLLLVCWGDHASYLSSKRLQNVLRDCSRDPRRFDAAALKSAEVRKTVTHLQTITYLLRRRFTQPRKAEPEKLIDGNDVMKALGIEPGPHVGKLLEAVREAQVEGKVKNRSQALALLPRLKTQ